MNEKVSSVTKLSLKKDKPILCFSFSEKKIYDKEIFDLRNEKGRVETMRLMRQFGIIAAMTCIGELMHYFIPLPVPGSIYGLLLMLAALMTGIVKLEQVRETAEFLIDAMPLMFIPAGVGLMTAWGQLRQILLPVTIITFVSTVAVMGVTGRVTELLLAVTARGRAKGETAAAELKEELRELASREAEKVKELVEEAEETVRNSADERKQHTLDKAEEKTSGREDKRKRGDGKP